MHKIIILYSFFIGSTIWISCSPYQTNAKVLTQADSLMETQPDSALNLLRSIKQSEICNNSDYALYALLFTQALDKNYLEHTNDSLISIAVNYYQHGTDKNKQAKAFFYLGRVYQDTGNFLGAIEAYLKAIDATPSSEDLLTLIYDNLATCYKSQRLYNKAKQMFWKSHQLNNKRPKEKLYAIRGIAGIYALQDSTQMALNYYLKALSMLRNTNDSTWMSAILCDIARTYETIGMHKEAEGYINQSIEYTPKNENASAIYFWKGEILYGLLAYDSASYYLKKATENSDLYTQASIYRTLYQLHTEKGNYQQAIQYNDTALLFSDSLQNLLHHSQLEDILKEHSIEIYKQELTNKHQKRIATLIIGTLAVLLLITSLTVYFCVVNKKTKLQLKLQIIKHQTESTLFKNKLRHLIRVHQNDEVEKEKMHNKHIQLWAQMIDVSAKLFETTISHQKLSALETIKFKQEKKLTIEEIDLIILDLNKAFNAPSNILSDMCPRLTSDDLLYCMLSYLKTPTNTICLCMRIGSTQALTQRKHRIKKQLDSAVFSYIFETKAT